MGGRERVRGNWGKGEGREGDWVEERGGEGDRVEREGKSDRVKSSVGGGAQEVHYAMVYLPVCSITVLQFTNGMGLRIPFNFSENFFLSC